MRFLLSVFISQFRDLLIQFIFFSMTTVSRGLFRWLLQGGARLEDFADRLNHVWTFGLLLVLGAVISWKNSYSDPISCWAPEQFTPALVEYTQNICWNNDYHYLLSKYGIIPINFHDRLRAKSYYQWVPLILCLQALLFKLPSVIMYVLHSCSGLDFYKLHGLTDGYQHFSLNERHNLANQIARYIYRWCNIFPRGLPWRLLTITWFVVKMMYCINVIIQMYYLDRFLKTTDALHHNSTTYGDVIYDNIVNNATWTASPAFPRIIHCYMEVIQLNNVQRYTFQCSLNNNPFTERVYMFLWVWILFVAVVTTLSFAAWFLLTILPNPRQR